MKSLRYQSESASHLDGPCARLEPTQSEHLLCDGSWWPDSSDLDEELRLLVPILDHVRGPVKRLVLSAEAWTDRSRHIVMDARTVTVDYRAGWSPWMMTVICADGGTFTIRVAPRGPAPGAAHGLRADVGSKVSETAGGVFDSLTERAVR
ncbi:DUF5994 family protein [Actinoplanes sp. NPDC024001]|uniref:DUF5994 family protein n=1 Tax=Actinoplanes sp. NPDC024001 TaxID=3154598 RepID=UPI0033DDB0A9